MTTRGNPSLERAARLLTVLAAEPEHSFTLADLVKRTELSKATCHALLTSLVDSRWLLRHPSGPSYRLGPGLIALGEAATRGYPALRFAEDEMRELGRHTGLECLASAVVGNEIVILAKNGTPAALSATAGIGARVPLVPPLATVFFAWSSEGVLLAAFGWANELDGSAAHVLSPKYRSGLEAVRERGYSIGLENPVRERLGRALATRLASGRAGGGSIAQLVRQLADEDYQLIETSGGPYWLNHLAAPIFDANGRVSLALTLVGFPTQLTADEVHDLGRRLRAAADRVTAAVHGSAPSSGASEEGKEEWL